MSRWWLWSLMASSVTGRSQSVRRCYNDMMYRSLSTGATRQSCYRPADVRLNCLWIKRRHTDVIGSMCFVLNDACRAIVVGMLAVYRYWHNDMNRDLTPSNNQGVTHITLLYDTAALVFNGHDASTSFTFFSCLKYLCTRIIVIIVTVVFLYLRTKHHIALLYCVQNYSYASYLQDAIMLCFL